jgi:ribosomal protein L12E/L44/L45/RPP1/RPP2/phenylpyruvate tautomerase PptA (4-oxalocrotonate tautomerase family)
MATKTEQKIYGAVGVLAVLLGGLYFVQKSEGEDAKLHGRAASSSLPEVKISAEDADKITKLDIHNAGKDEVVLEKDGDVWKVTKPVNFPANQQNVKSLLDNLKEVKLKDVIDTGATQYGTYDLGDDKSVHVQAFKGDAKAADLYFGKSGSRGQMTRVADKDGVYVATGYSSYLYARDVKDWRDRDILKFDDANVMTTEISNENGNFAFAKNGETWTATFKGRPIKNFDESKLKDMLRLFKSLAAEDFADGKGPAETGLDKPASVTITAKDSGQVKLLVGKTSSGTSRYAQKDGNPTVVVISSFAADWVVAGESKFQKPESKDGGK